MQMQMEQIRSVRLRLLPPASVASRADCLAAVNRLGFLWPFTPGNDLLPALFPALDTQSEGQRWDWVWGWKDSLSATRDAYYGRVVGGKPTLVSTEWLPVFYALTGNTGDVEEDLAALAESTRLNDFAHQICRYLGEHGPTGTRTLHQRLTDGTRPMKRALEKGLEQLDTAMLIVKCGTEGSNSIANQWSLFPQFHPEAVEAGTAIATRDAALRLLRQFFTLTPAISDRQFGLVFPWNAHHQEKAIARLLEAGELMRCVVDGKPGLCRAEFAAPIG